VSETVSRDKPVPGGQQDPPDREDAPRGPRGGRRRGRWVALGIVVVVAAGGAVAAWRTGVFSPAASSATGQEAPAPATAAVTRQDLSATTPVSGTLGYAGTYTVRGQAGGTLTWLPSPGQVITQGHVLYTAGLTSPVVLLYGSAPDWRTLDEGVTGADVTQLNHDLVALGYADRASIAALGWDYYSWQTAAGVRELQSHLGIAAPSGSLSKGQAVFEPEALRVGAVTGSLGNPATGPVFSATSNRHIVTINLDTSLESQVKAGDPVSVTMPDGAVTPGVTSSVGTVATQSGGSATIPVYVRLTHQSAAGSLDQAPVTVNLTTGAARNVLVVPVTALVAQSSHGYVVEVVGSGGTRRLVPVKAGPVFDDADGLVQVTGDLTPGQRVVVAAS
jgi:hypothetical protein